MPSRSPTVYSFNSIKKQNFLRVRTDHKFLYSFWARSDMFGTHQLLDALTDHRALYHRKALVSTPTSLPHQKSDIKIKSMMFQWFKGLTSDQRYFILTIFDRSWVAIILQMQKHLTKEGPGFFFLLTDVLQDETVSKPPPSLQQPFRSEQGAEVKEAKRPKRSGKSRKKALSAPVQSVNKHQGQAIALPGLCFRRARGLLARLNEDDVAGELLCQNVELFSSNESEVPGLDFLDTVSINENLLQSADEFLRMMDSITHGQFLLSSRASQDSSWEELPWLKSMGYYSLSAFIANKIELVLWSAWLRDHRTPRNLSKDLRKIGCIVKSGSSDASASTVCRRNQSFRNWWMHQSEEVRLKSSRFAVARAAKVEIVGAVRTQPNSRGVSECKEKHLSNSELERRKCFSPLLAGLEGIQELMSSYLYPVLYGHLNSSQCTDYRWLYSSSLRSAGSLTDRVVRRARSALQLIMVESVKVDLLKGDSFNPALKKKRRNRKKQNSAVLRSSSLRNSENEPLQETAALPQEQIEADLDIASTTGGEKGDTIGKIVDKSCAGRQKKHSKSRQKNMQEHSVAKDCNTEANRRGAEKEDIKLHLQHKVITQMADHHEVSTNSDVTEFSNQGACICEMLTANDTVRREIIDHTQECTFIQKALHSSNIVPEGTSSTEGTSLSNISNHLKESEDQRLLKKSNAFSDKNEQFSLKESSIQIPLGPSTACNNAVNAYHDELGMKSEAKMPFKTKPINSESKQGHLTVSNHPSTPTNASRSTCSSHAARERYWEGHRSHTFNPQRSTFAHHTAHEWPRTSPVCFSRGRSQIVTPATERLHLDVGRNWQQRLQASLTALRNPIIKQQACVVPNTKWSSNKQSNFKSPECAQPFPSGFNVIQNRGYSLGPKDELTDFPFPQASFPDLDFLSALTKAQEELKHDDITPDNTDCDECNNIPGGYDEHESYMISEEESERQYLDFNRDYEGDYNQYFGGGVMFWNTADFAGTGYSRPPSLSSDDSAWARHEADLSVVLDDTMGFSAAYTNVVSPRLVSTSPPTTYHPGFEYNPVSGSTTRVGLAITGNDFGKFSQLPPVLSVKSEGEQAKSLHDSRKIDIDVTVPDGPTRPVLRPIIVVHDRSIDRKIPGSESDKAGSPHVHRTKREFPWLRRPPSPVLRCVPPPPPPPPPPPSPVSGFGKRKGLTTVRSGSSSPRQWGLFNSHCSEEQDVPFVLSEILESAWGSQGIRENTPIHPISGTLLHERFFAVTPLSLETEHPDVALPMQTTLLYKTSDPSMQSSLTSLHSILHKEIEGFCSQVAAENLLRKVSISAAVEKVSHAMRVLWPRSRLKIFGSNATGLALPCSDVDLVVCLPPVRNLEPIKEAGILEGRNGIKETCLQHAARYLADQDWVLSDTIKTIENTAIPIIMLVAYIPNTNDIGGSTHTSNSSHEVKLSEERKGPWGFHSHRDFVRLDISFESPSHTGLRTAELVRELTARFPAIVPLALVLKQFLTVRSLDHPYTGGLSSYCLVLLITRFLQHQRHLGCPFQLNLGCLLMDFLHFFGCIFDPRRMGVSIRGGGMYVNRNHGHRIDPLHIEDPLHPSNNVGRNCFRILQCVKAFADAYSFFEKTLMEIPINEINNQEVLKLLSSILSSSDSSMESDAV